VADLYLRNGMKSGSTEVWTVGCSPLTVRSRRDSASKGIYLPITWRSRLREKISAWHRALALRDRTDFIL
jgi:hypothetical protein